MEKQDVNIHENIYSARILYCPECGAANLLGSVSEQEIELSREKHTNNKPVVTKSELSEYFLPILVISGILSIFRNGPTINIIGWPLLIIYIWSNAIKAGWSRGEDVLITLGGIVIWIVNVVMVFDVYVFG